MLENLLFQLNSSSKIRSGKLLRVVKYALHRKTMEAMCHFQLRSRDGCFVKILYIRGYRLKNSRNGKSISNIPKWPSLRSLALKSEFIRQFEFLENL